MFTQLVGQLPLADGGSDGFGFGTVVIGIELFKQLREFLVGILELAVLQQLPGDDLQLSGIDARLLLTLGLLAGARDCRGQAVVIPQG